MDCEHLMPPESLHGGMKQARQRNVPLSNFPRRIQLERPADVSDSKQPHLSVEFKAGPWFLSLSIGSLGGLLLAFGGMTAAVIIAVSVLVVAVIMSGSQESGMGPKPKTPTGVGSKASMVATTQIASIVAPASVAVLLAGAVALVVAAADRSAGTSKPIEPFVGWPEVTDLSVCDSMHPDDPLDPSCVSNEETILDAGVVDTTTSAALTGARRPGRMPPPVKFGSTSVSGRLPSEAIYRTVSLHTDRFRLCFQNGLRNNPNLQGRVAVRFIIGRDGAVSNVGNGGSDVPDSGVVSCVVRSFYGLSFPPPEGGIVTVVIPIFLAAGSTSVDVPIAAQRDRDGGVKLEFYDAGILQLMPDVQVGEEDAGLVRAPPRIEHGGLLLGPKKPTSTIVLPDRLPDSSNDADP